MATRKDRKRTTRRTLRVRNGIKKGDVPRISVFRSLNHIYGQIIDDRTGNTIASSSSYVLENSGGDKKFIAHEVGKNLARIAKEKGIDRVVFDRGAYLFHGRVKALAQGLRDGGIQI